MIHPHHPLRQLGIRLACGVCLVMLAGCRVDVTIDVDVTENGSGELSVTVEADAAVVAAAPGLAEDVRIGDLEVAGWTSDGTTPTPDGGLSLTIVHPFDTPEQATALLSTLNGPSGPLQAVSIQRQATISEITYTVTGSGRLDGGLDAFADAELLASVGGTPYAERITASAAAPTETVGVVLRLRMPGEVRSTSGDVFSSEDGATDEGAVSVTVAATEDVGGNTSGERPSIDWVIAVDGSDTSITATTVKSLDRGGGWSILASALKVLLIMWMVLSVGVILLVARRRHQRRRSIRRIERGLAELPYERVYHDDHTS